MKAAAHPVRPLVRALFSDCKVHPVATGNRLRNNRTTKSATFGELLITRE